ncbi:hypothetical protein NECAME_08302 [Necator americanus]|uniref:Protein MIS12 homolog n=1 Tax=Necator americanus TaxID=51031 RepID=W2TL08_NECAM|nr:hypothetical protein NECAME_08302 [Necator americanus]ETN81717.1 hypothetical protein NECAME_08302 [Necator americanus]
MEVPEAELINEFECQYYGFSPAGFTDSVYNIAIKSWEEAVKEVVSKEPRLARVANNKMFLTELTGMIFDRKAVRMAFNTFTDRVLKYIFRIPRCVTLPEHMDTFMLMLSDDPNQMDVSDLDRQCKKLEDCIVEKRFILNDLNEEIREANDVVEVLSTLVMELEKISPSADLESINISCGDINVTG